MPNTLLKKMFRIVISFTLNILRHCKANCTCVRRVCKHTHCIKASSHKLLRANNSVKIMANTLKCIGNRSAVIIKKFCLLKYRVRLATRKSITRQNKKRNSVCSGATTCSYHICCTRADRRNARNNGFSIHLLSICNCGKCHILLIFTLVKFEIMTALFQSLANTYNTAVAENAKHSANKFCFNTVTFDILIIKELYECL